MLHGHGDMTWYLREDLAQGGEAREVGRARRARVFALDRGDELPASLDEQVSRRGFGSSSEYVREHIRKDQERLQLRSLLLAGAAPASAAPADAAHFAPLRARVHCGCADGDEA